MRQGAVLRGMRAERGDPRDADFVAFATAVAGRLRQTAYLLCHDWHLAQDLTQTTLAKTYLSWDRVSAAGDPEAYSRKILLHTFLDHRRVRSSSEVVTDEVPTAGHDDRGSGSDLRITLLEALKQLPPRDRAIVVLRYWEDHSIATVAELLHLPEATVKTQSSRGLARLRRLLGDDRLILTSS